MKGCPYCGRFPEAPEDRCRDCGADRSFDPTVRGGTVLLAMIVAFGWLGVCLYFGGYRGDLPVAVALGLLPLVVGFFWRFGRRWRQG